MKHFYFYHHRRMWGDRPWFACLGALHVAIAAIKRSNTGRS